MRSTTRLSLLALTLSAAIAVAACGGSTPATTGTPGAVTAAPSTASLPPAPTPAPSTASLPPAPTPAGSTAATAAPTSAPSAGGAVDFDEVTAHLAAATSYKMVVTTEGGPAAGTGTFVVVRKPVLARSFEGNFGGAATRVIIIGTDVWVDGGAGQWTKNVIPLIVAEGMLSVFDPATLFLGMAAWANSGGLVRVGVEDKNGVRAVHYHLDKSTVPTGTPIADNATIDVWVAEEGGFVVSMKTVGLSNPGGPDSLAMDLSNIDDPSLTIVAPT